MVLHGTHLSNVVSNMLYDVRGAQTYVEDNNEMYTVLPYNVAICPWNFHGESGCMVLGTSNRIGDTSDNQSGIYMKQSANHLIGNRMANQWNGMLLHSIDHGRGPVIHNVTDGSRLGRWEGNTFHSIGRSGT